MNKKKCLICLVAAAAMCLIALGIDFKRGVAVDGVLHLAPNATTNGYYEIVDVCPACTNDCDIMVVDHWENVSNQCVCVYKEVAAPTNTVESVAEGLSIKDPGTGIVYTIGVSNGRLYVTKDDDDEDSSN